MFRLCGCVRVSWLCTLTLPMHDRCDTRLVERSVVRRAVLSQRGAQHEHELVVVLGTRLGSEPPARRTGCARSTCVPSADRCPRSRPATCRFPTCRHDTECATLQRDGRSDGCAALNARVRVCVRAFVELLAVRIDLAHVHVVLIKYHLRHGCAWRRARGRLGGSSARWGGVGRKPQAAATRAS